MAAQIVNYVPFIFYQRASKSQNYKRYITRAPENMDFSNYEFSDMPSLTMEDCANFLAYLPPNYTCGRIQSTSQKETRPILDGETKIYQYDIRKSSSCVYLRYYLVGESFMWNKHGTYTRNSIKYDVFTFNPAFTNNQIIAKIAKGADAYEASHPYRVFSKKMQKHPLATPLFKSSAQNLKVKSTKSEFISKDMFEKFHGYYYINTIDDSSYPMMILDNEEIKNVHSLVYVVSAYDEIIKDSNCIELDCSFYLMRPYVYCIPNIIINNESVPIGLVIGPTEKSEIYDAFYQYIKNLNADCYIKLVSKPVLSDQGSALISFVKKHNLIHFLCIRHIINKMGSSSILSSIAGSLLFSQNPEEFMFTWSTSKHQIIKELQNSEPKRIRQFTSLFCAEFNKDTSELSDPDVDNLTQNLWIRAQYGVPTCSNHSESTHALLNKQSKGMKNFPKRINVALIHIEQRLVNFRKRRNLVEKIRSIKKIKKYEIECHCVQNPYLNALYGVIMPCCHNVKQFVVHEFDAIDISKTFQFTCAHYNDTDWVFPQKKKFPNIEYCGDEALLSTIYGKPDMSNLKQVVQQLATSEKMPYSDTKKFVSKVFITFSAKYFGFYNYEAETISIFQIFIRNMLYTTSEDINVNYEMKERKKNIALLKKLVSEADCTSFKEYNESEKTSQRPERKRKERLKRIEKKEAKINNDKEERAQLFMNKIVQMVNELSNKTPMEFVTEVINQVKIIENEMKK